MGRYGYGAGGPSTVIDTASYDAAANTLDIVFTNGRAYRYFAVPATVYEELLAAPSKGRYFNEVIRPRYPAGPIEDPGSASAR